MTSLAASLCVVLLAAKIIVLAGRSMPDHLLAPLILIWQDVAVVLGVAVLERFLRPRWPVRAVYAALALLAIVNVPVIRALSSPVTARMLDATDGALSDSMLHYATITNIVSVAALVSVGAALPFIRATVWPGWLRHGSGWATAGVAVCVAGWAGSRTVDTRGLERNAAATLLLTSLPRVGAHAAAGDWRAPLNDTVSPADDLSPLRGTARGMNVLLVVLESTGASYLRPYGAAADPMPNLTAFASRSIVFDNAYAVYPESVKGMVATFAAQYPAFDVAAAGHTDAMRSSVAHVLDSAGYATAIFHSGRFMYLGMDALVAGSGFGQREDAGDIGGNRKSSFGIDEAAAVARVLSWIDSVSRKGPFFAAYLPVAGHHPYGYSLPGPFADSTDHGRYLNALHEGDASLGTLLNGLRLRGLDSTTIILVAGDHGEAFGQHEGNYGHTLEIYEENVRVPMMLSVPGAAAKRVSNVASLLDLSPTILDLLNIDIPDRYQGESLLDSRERAALFFTDYSLGLLGIRDGCTKVVYEIESRRTRAFDVCIDPGEKRPLKGISGAYRDRLDAWVSAQIARVKSRSRRAAFGAAQQGRKGSTKTGLSQ